ncbi:MAG: hypothetical protein PHO37_05295 [Kiritimatiellae bacterium]|nr:hypothetical protein [Kiritimatiellia bacterium]
MAEKEKIDELRKSGWLLLLLVAGALLFAVHNRFVQDDAFISFRYAQNLANGHGLVWNIGERVEGYTNFLWTLAMASAFLLGVDVVTYCFVVSLLCFICNLLLVYYLANILWQSRWSGFVAVLLVGTNYSFSSYATGGLETQFGILWILLTLTAATNAVRRNNILLSAVGGISAACAVMTRMDAILFVLPMGAIFFFDFNKTSLKQVLVFGLSAALPLSIWLLLRHEYYGDWLPNTFYIKTQGVTFVRGFYYQALFYLVYALFAPVIIALFHYKSLYRLCNERAVAMSLMASILLWSLYLMRVGGDFMEFRLMMPPFVLLIILLVGIVHTSVPKILKLGLLMVLVTASCLHATLGYQYPSLQTIKDLKECHREWQDIALAMNRLFATERDKVRIGVTTAGIIPFYTELPAFDLLGLNNRDIAMNGSRVTPVSGWLGTRPGHAKVADWDQVLKGDVDLLINHPWVVSANELTELSRSDVLSRWDLNKGHDKNRIYHRFVKIPEDVIADDAWPGVVAWPLGDQRFLVSIYVRQSAAVDAAIRRSGAMKIIAPTGWLQ